MDLRIVIGAVGFVIAIFALNTMSHDMMQGFTGVFVALGVLLIFAVVALFPSLNRGDSADSSKAGGSWSDRIEFEDAPSSENAKNGGGWR